VRRKVSLLAGLALMVVLALPFVHSVSANKMSSKTPYVALADTTPDPSGGHGMGSGMKLAPPQRASGQYRAGQSRGTLPAFIEIIATLLSAIRLL
jgi:hypothetical protein